MARQPAQGGEQAGQALAHRLAGRNAAGRAVPRVEEQRQREDREPQRHEGAGGAHLLGRVLVEAEDRRLGLDEQHQAERQADQPTGIAQAPGPTRDPAQAPGAGDLGQHGVVEHLAELEGGVAEPDQDQGEQREARVRFDPPQPGGAEDREGGEAADPGLAPPALIGERAEDRRQQRHRQARKCDRLAPKPGSRLRRLGQRGGEVGRKDEGHDHGGKRGIGPVVETPGDQATAVRRSAACFAGCVGCRGHGRSKPPLLQGAYRIIPPERLQPRATWGPRARNGRRRGRSPAVPSPSSPEDRADLPPQSRLESWPAALRPR